jgi:hypothetical protein
VPLPVLDSEPIEDRGYLFDKTLLGHRKAIVERADSRRRVSVIHLGSGEWQPLADRPKHSGFLP